MSWFLGGLPLHPLVVHATVVLVPLAVLGAIVVVLVPAARRRYGSLVVVTAAVATVCTVLAAQPRDRGARRRGRLPQAVDGPADDRRGDLRAHAPPRRPHRPAGGHRDHRGAGAGRSASGADAPCAESAAGTALSAHDQGAVLGRDARGGPGRELAREEHAGQPPLHLLAHRAPQG